MNLLCNKPVFASDLKQVRYMLFSPAAEVIYFCRTHSFMLLYKFSSQYTIYGLILGVKRDGGNEKYVGRYRWRGEEKVRDQEALTG